MTNEEKRIKIAEACGWIHVANGVQSKLRKYAPLAELGGFWLTPERLPCYDSNYLSHSAALPDYLNDLNAMHEAERLCIIGQHDMEYREALGKVCGQYQIIWHATAAQRAEAFLRTIGKWID